MSINCANKYEWMQNVLVSDEVAEINENFRRKANDGIAYITSNLFCYI
jgi:hypothetical protein